jgi:integrase
MSRPAPHTRVPGYCFHKARGTAYVRLNGEVKYLPGPYGSPESRAEYDRLVGLWQLNGRTLPPEVVHQAHPALLTPLPAPATVATGKTVDQLIEAFLAEAEKEYPPKDGRRNSEFACIESALASLHLLYGRFVANAVEPLHVEQVLKHFVERGFCRKMVNRNLSYVKRLFKWGVRRKFVTGEMYYQITTVDGLRRGRSGARDNPKVRPVEVSIVEATIPFLGDEVAAMVRLQLLTAMRGDEVMSMREMDLDRSEKVWRYDLEKHKTAHHGIGKCVPIGPKAQEIIKPFLTGKPMEYLFSPRRAEEKRRAAAHANRKAPLTCGNKPGTNRKLNPARTPGERYYSDTYGKAVARACRKAFKFPPALSPDTTRMSEERKAKYVAEHGQEAYDRHHAEVLAWKEKHWWHPHQLRHTTGTQVARRYGEITSQNLLGHASLRTTAVYVERDFAQAAKVMLEIG